MSNDLDIVPPKRIIRLKHLLFGIIILLSGIMIGFVAGAYTVGKHFEYFRPKPSEIAGIISGKIIDDFPYLDKDRDKIEYCINSEFKNFRMLDNEVSYRILQLQHDIALQIEKIIPNPQDRQRWMATFPQYFPGHKHRMFKAKKFEEKHKHGSDGCMLDDWDRPPPPPPLGN